MVEANNGLAVGARVEINGRVEGEVVTVYRDEVRVRTDVSDECYLKSNVEEI